MKIYHLRPSSAERAMYMHALFIHNLINNDVHRKSLDFAQSVMQTYNSLQTYAI